MEILRWAYRTSAIFLGVCMVLCSSHAVSQTAGEELPSIVITGPTLIAFCEPISDAQMEEDPNLADVLSDFQLYASRARAPLQNTGIRFEVLSASSFAVITAGHRTKFHPRISVGYYFIAPGKPPRVEYGVRTDPDILEIAHEYFSLAAK